MDAVTVGVRKLPVKLTESELAHDARAMADLLRQASDLENVKHETVQELNESIAAKYEAASEIAAQVNAGSVDRDVEVELQHDFGANKVTVTRLDTGEVVEERAMTAHEREELEQPRLAVDQIESLPGCPGCGHLEDVHAEAYVSPAGDQGGQGERILVCSIDRCRCKRPIVEVGAPEIKITRIRKARKPRGKHAAAGDEATA